MDEFQFASALSAGFSLSGATHTHAGFHHVEQKSFSSYQVGFLIASICLPSVFRLHPCGDFLACARQRNGQRSAPPWAEGVRLLGSVRDCYTISSRRENSEENSVIFT